MSPAMAVILAEEGERSPVNVSVSSGTVVWLIVAAVVLLVIVALVALILLRRPSRRARLRQAFLEVQLDAMPEGPRRAVVRLRLQLDEALAATRAAVALEGDGPSFGELGAIASRLDRMGDRLARQLDAVRSEAVGDRALGKMIPLLRDRVRAVESLADSVCTVAARTTAGAQEPELAALRQQVDDEAEALEAGVETLRRLGSPQTDGQANQRGPR